MVSFSLVLSVLAVAIIVTPQGGKGDETTTVDPLFSQKAISILQADFNTYVYTCNQTAGKKPTDSEADACLKARGIDKDTELKEGDYKGKRNVLLNSLCCAVELCTKGGRKVTMTKAVEKFYKEGKCAATATGKSKAGKTGGCGFAALTGSFVVFGAIQKGI